ncbi:hypothetical protein V1525DRAFT_224883 [Lipomyces kononenkoae]|uniref:Uncharacterized protein n=1 Tax=Lipomyces kononenkoae TaxID=34357 RepID=A0ACC3T9A9_LIPKO
MRSDRRASPLYLSARSNALHFYDPSPQRRHLQQPAHYPHPNQQLRQQRAAFYELFAPEPSVAAELPSTESSSSNSSSKDIDFKSTTTAPRDQPSSHSYRSLLDPDESQIPRSSPAPTDTADALLDLMEPEDDPSRFGPSSDSESSSAESDSESDYGPQVERKQFPRSSPTRLAGRSESVLPLPLAILAESKTTSSGASIRSFRSRTSVLSWSRKRKHYRPTLDTLPLEVLDEICCCLPQQALLSLVNTCKALACSAYVYLYQEPRFTSTYRFAQFVSVITHDRTLASYVRALDLSTVEDGLRGNVVLAGWRDWKYRTEPLYWTRKYSGHHYFHHQYRYRANTVPSSKAALQAPPKPPRPDRRSSLSLSSSSSAASSTSSLASSQKSAKSNLQHLQPRPELTRHPLQSPLLKQYALSRDVPIGAIIHVVRACPHLQHINLSYLPLAADYYVTSRKYKPTAFTNLLFVSDVPKSYTWREHETVQVLAGRELVGAIMELRELQTLELRNLVWITKDIISRIVGHDRLRRTLTYIDARESGMTRGRPWALAGRPDAFSVALQEE